MGRSDSRLSEPEDAGCARQDAADQQAEVEPVAGGVPLVALESQGAGDKEPRHQEDARERGVGVGGSALRRQRVLDGQAKVAAAPVVGGRPQHELGEGPPALGEVVHRAQDAQHGIGLGAATASTSASRKVRSGRYWGARRVEGAGRHLLVRAERGGIEARVALEVEAADLRLGVGDGELGLQVAPHGPAARPDEKPAGRRRSRRSPDRRARRSEIAASRFSAGVMVAALVRGVTTSTSSALPAAALRLLMAITHGLAPPFPPGELAPRAPLAGRPCPGLPEAASGTPPAPASKSACATPPPWPVGHGLGEADHLPRAASPSSPPRRRTAARSRTRSIDWRVATGGEPGIVVAHSTAMGILLSLRLRTGCQQSRRTPPVRRAPSEVVQVAALGQREGPPAIAQQLAEALRRRPPGLVPVEDARRPPRPARGSRAARRAGGCRRG